eukprot:3157589-Pyramimonas_sp.AAC.1
MYQVCREFRRLEPDGGLDHWALNAVVVAGGQWPRERQRAAGYVLSPTCQRCLKEPEESVHR